MKTRTISVEVPDHIDGSFWQSPEYQQVIRAICSDPDDDLPRLAAADFFEEIGWQDRADLIRRQVQVAAECDPSSEEYQAERAASDATEWRTGGPGVFRVWRGFPYRVEINGRELVKHAEEMFAAMPITEVRITDMSPGWRCEGNSSFWAWEDPEGDVMLFRGGTAMMPPARPVVPLAISRTPECRPWLFSPDGFRFVADARSALSEACVIYGRLQAGLPTLDRHAPCNAPGSSGEGE